MNNDFIYVLVQTTGGVSEIILTAGNLSFIRRVKKRYETARPQLTYTIKKRRK